MPGTGTDPVSKQNPPQRATMRRTPRSLGNDPTDRPQHRQLQLERADRGEHPQCQFRRQLRDPRRHDGHRPGLAVKFAECIRSNGVSDFPDPNPSGDSNTGQCEPGGVTEGRQRRSPYGHRCKRRLTFPDAPPLTAAQVCYRWLHIGLIGAVAGDGCTQGPAAGQADGADPLVAVGDDAGGDVGVLVERSMPHHSCPVEPATARMGPVQRLPIVCAGLSLDPPNL